MPADKRSQLRRVLYVAFSFPPDSNIGAIRSERLVRHLPKFGWEPVVLTGDKAYGHSASVKRGESGVVRVKYRDPARFLLGSTSGKADAADQRKVEPGTKRRDGATSVIRKFRSLYGLPAVRMLTMEPALWYFPAKQVARSLVDADRDVALVFSTYGPSTSHFVASRISRETGIPWVAEFRDIWSMSSYGVRCRLLERVERWIEKKTLTPVSRLVTVSQPIADELSRLHGKQVDVIPSGFDGDDYSASVPLTAKFTITYTGRLYHGRRDPTELFKALRLLRQEDESLLSNLEVRFVGFNSGEVIGRLVEEYSLGDTVKFVQQVPFKESVRLQKESTLLLLLSWNDPRDEGTYTGKLFEYLGAGRPILATSVYEGGGIPKLLSETGSGVIANDAATIRDILRVWLMEFQREGKVHSFLNPNAEMIQAYTWESQARKLAAAFDRALVKECGAPRS
jgi:glycosyltransferase involved in cell wall biosynthesis